MTYRKGILALAAGGGFAAYGSAAIVFEDGFESGDFSMWPEEVNPGMTVTNFFSHTGNYCVDTFPADTTRRAASFAPIATDQDITFSYWLHDDVGTGFGRQFSEIRSYTGDAWNTGLLDQLYAIGIYNTVTMTGEVHNMDKYQARITFGTTTGWFNLSDAADRTIGWHEFKIVLSGSTASFYVDGVLGRTFDRGNIASIDSVVMGSGVSSVQAAFYDDFLITAVPEPGTFAAIGLGALSLLRRRCRR